MRSDWDVVGWPGWLSAARLAADLVIVGAGLSVARVLWGLLTVTDGKTTAPRVSRLFVALAALLALCGVSHLAVVLIGRTSTPVGPVVLKVLVAALWVLTAVRVRSFAAGARRSAPAARRAPDCASLDAGTARGQNPVARRSIPQ